MFKKPSTSSAPFSAAPGFRRMKMNTLLEEKVVAVAAAAAAAAAAAVVVVVMRGGKLEFKCFEAQTFST